MTGQGDVQWTTAFRDVCVPPEIEDETLAFILGWMYNESPTLDVFAGRKKLYDVEEEEELDEEEEEKRNGEKRRKFVSNLQLAARMLGIPDLIKHLDAISESIDDVKEEVKLENDDVSHKAVNEDGVGAPRRSDGQCSTVYECIEWLLSMYR